MDTKYELGKYKKKVADQQKEIDRLKEDLAGQEQLQSITYALIAVLLNSLGASQDQPAKLGREAVTEALGKYNVLAHVNDGAYQLYCVER